MTFGFNDYRKRLQTSSRFFTRGGWATFNDALTKSNMLELVTANQQVVTAVPREAPVVIKEGPVDNDIAHNDYQWVVQLPLNVTYLVGAKEENRPQLITMVIVRVSTLETPDGIAIDQWIAQDLR
jgi:intracellular multiplication protein IcmL